MTSSSSDTESESYQTDDSDRNYIPGPHIIREATEVEAFVGEAMAMDDHDQAEVRPYADEPVADEEWLAQYREKKQSYDERIAELQKRLDGREQVAKWCSCGNCDVQLLQNPKACQCCMEVDECKECLSSELVLREVENQPSCVTHHLRSNSRV